MVKHNKGSAGGYLVGNSHANGGIKGTNNATGQPLEMEGGEAVITKKAVADGSKREFEGQMLTNRQILSRINQSGGGVAFEEGGQVPHRCGCSGKQYNYGGKLMTDYEIVNEMSEAFPDEIATGAAIEHDEHKTTFDQLYNGEITPEQAARQIAEEHLRTNPDYYQDEETMHIRHEQYRNGGLFADISISSITEFTKRQSAVLKQFANNITGHYQLPSSSYKNVIKPLVDGGILFAVRKPATDRIIVMLTQSGRDFVKTAKFELGGTVADEVILQNGSLLEEPVVYKSGGMTYLKGVDASYANAFEVNKAIEELLDSRPEDFAGDFSYEEKCFLKYYSGYGGLEKFGASGKGLLYEYFTPADIAKRMWGLAYKYGYSGGSMIEPAVGIGEFLQYAPEGVDCDVYEINPYSARICKILYPWANVQQKYFEQLFIRNNESIRNKTTMLKQYDLVIGNPPYGSFEGKFKGMGEGSYTKANNYIEYFILRGLDLLKPKGLLIYVIGTEVAAGGTPFLGQDVNNIKQSIMDKSNLLDAYRLPNGVFDRTDVLTDIIVLQKK